MGWCGMVLNLKMSRCLVSASATGTEEIKHDVKEVRARLLGLEKWKSNWCIAQLNLAL